MCAHANYFSAYSGWKLGMNKFLRTKKISCKIAENLIFLDFYFYHKKLLKNKKESPKNQEKSLRVDRNFITKGLKKYFISINFLL